MNSEGPRFTRRREDFTCANCLTPVHGDGYTNHCPRCLWSRHVDVAPGDRAAACGGLMRPVGVLFEGGRHVLVHECTRCGQQRRNRAAAGDSRIALLGLFGRPVPAPPTPGRGRRSPRR